MVSVRSGYFCPQLEVWDPNGAKIIDTYTCDHKSVDKTLSISGTYLLAISDHYLDDTGNYDIEIICITGSCPEPPLFNPAISISLNQSSFHSGDTLIASAHVVNGPDSAKVEGKIWILLPSGGESPIGNSHLTFTVAPDADFTREVLKYTFSGGDAPGNYQIGGRFINPVTGREFNVDVAPFSFTP